MNMGRVITGLSMSLDGFIAGPNDSPERPLGDGGERILAWYFSGDTDYELPSGTMTFKIANGWGGRHPLDVPVFVVTHTVPREWVYEGSPFTFVTDGVQSAVEKAKNVAGDKDVAVGAASIVQQCIRAGLLEEIHIDLVPVLLGDGVRLFDHLDTEPIELESTRVIEAPGITHLTFRVVKEN